MDQAQAKELFQKAMQFYRDKQFADALQIFNQLDAAFPNMRSVQYHRAACMAWTRDYTGAFAICKALHQKDPQADTEKLLQWLNERVGQSSPFPAPSAVETSPAEPRIPDHVHGHIDTGAAGDPEAALREFALRHSILLDENPFQAESAAEAKAELKKWKERMPKTRSAYKPSGKMPAAAFFKMALGALVGIPGGGIAGLGIAAVGSLAMFFVGWLTALLESATGKVFCWPAIIFILLGIATYFLTYIGIGIASAKCVVEFGKRGNNRSATFAAILAVPSAVFACFFFKFVTDIIVGLTTDEPGAKFISVANFLTLGVAIFAIAIGLVIALVATAMAAVHFVAETRFCEECQKPMETKPLNSVSPPGLRVVHAALHLGEIDQVRNALDFAAGDAGNPTLHVCPGCRRGFIDVEAQYSQQWSKKGLFGRGETEKSNEKWIAASRALEADQTEMLIPFAKPKTS
jgi:hypothetical protein